MNVKTFKIDKNFNMFVVSSLYLMSHKVGAHEADPHSSPCVHIETKCAAVETDLLYCLLVK